MEARKNNLPISDLEPDLKKQKVEIEDSDDQVETSLGKSREERLQMYMESLGKKEFSDESDDDEEIGSKGYREMTFRDFASLRLDFIEHGGFDVEEDYSKIDCCGAILRFYDSTVAKYTMSDDDEDLIEIIECAQQAIDEYNKKMNTHFDNVHVLKANTEALSPYRYYITFQASDKAQNITHEFQAKVAVRIPITVRKVELVRIRKPLEPIFITRPRVRAP